MSEALNKWHKRWSKKGPIYVHKTKKILYGGVSESMKEWREARGITEHPENKLGLTYFVVYRDKDKVKYGTFSDGMYARYGTNTLATLSGPSLTYLWQSSAGKIDDDQAQAMLTFFTQGELPGQPTLVTTDLEGVKW